MYTHFRAFGTNMHEQHKWSNYAVFSKGLQPFCSDEEEFNVQPEHHNFPYCVCGGAAIVYIPFIHVYTQNKLLHKYRYIIHSYRSYRIKWRPVAAAAAAAACEQHFPFEPHGPRPVFVAPVFMRMLSSQ